MAILEPPLNVLYGRFLKMTFWWMKESISQLVSEAPDVSLKRVRACLCDVLRVEIHIQFSMQGAYIQFLAVVLSPPVISQYELWWHVWELLTRTVKSLINVDLPAPFGPITPTRLYTMNEVQYCRQRHAHLDRESAQLTSIKLGDDFPGYVKVQLVILRMARVLLRTPMRDPGGGKANLTEVAARV